MDVLSDILDTIRFRGSLYFSTEFTRPWGVEVPAYRRVARFHLVVRGRCWVSVKERGDPLPLEAGDLVLVPHGAAHLLRDDPGTACRTVDEVIEAAGFSGDGALVYGGDDEGGPTRLVCGHFEFDPGFEHPFFDRLPPALVVRWEDAVQDSPLEHVFRFITREIGEGRPGQAAVVRRLSEVLFVQAIRFWARDTQPEQGLLAALAQPGLGEALEAIHGDPSASWTLESLSRRAAMSRTLFAERFREVVGETPHQYVTLWRMQRARRLLADSRFPLARIAREVGYESAPSFSRVFKKSVGEPPGAYRRRVREAPAGG